jgi:hypothetical protein
MIPAGVARVIWAVAPNAGVREAMLGDFEEEYGARAQRAGVRAARRWCWQQAAYSLFDTLRHSFPRPAMLATNVLPAVVWGYLVYALSAAAGTAVLLPLIATLKVLGMDQNHAFMVVGFPLIIPAATISGYEMARVGAKAPLWSALLLPIVLNALGMGLLAIRIAPAPAVTLWLQLPIGVVLLTCMLAGAVMQQAQRHRLAARPL